MKTNINNDKRERVKYKKNRMIQDHQKLNQK